MARQRHKTGRNRYMTNGDKMTDIPDFTDEEIRNAQDLFNERYGKEIELQLADTEIRPDPSVCELVEVPVPVWAEHDANFVIVKLDKNKFCSQPFYRGYRQFGTRYQVFDDTGNCVITTLQVQADHEAKEQS